MGEVVTPNYAQAQVLAVEVEETPEIAAGDSGNDETPVTKQGTNPQGMYNPNVCWRCGQIAPTKTHNQQRHWGDCTIHWRQKVP